MKRLTPKQKSAIARRLARVKARLSQRRGRKFRMAQLWGARSRKLRQHGLQRVLLDIVRLK